MAYPLGELVTITGVFTIKSNGAAIDPTNVYLEVQDPNGGITTYTYGVSSGFTKTGTGVYVYQISAGTAGVYYYRMYSTGTGQTSKFKQFTVVDYTKKS